MGLLFLAGTLIVSLLVWWLIMDMWRRLAGPDEQRGKQAAFPYNESDWLYIPHFVAYVEALPLQSVQSHLKQLMATWLCTRKAYSIRLML